MAGTRHNRTGDEWFIDMLLAVSRGLQIYRSAGRKHDNKCSLTNEIYFECSGVSAAVNAGMKTVRMVRSGWKLRSWESMTR